MYSIKEFYEEGKSLNLKKTNPDKEQVHAEVEESKKNINYVASIEISLLFIR